VRKRRQTSRMAFHQVVTMSIFRHTFLVWYYGWKLKRLWRRLERLRRKIDSLEAERERINREALDIKQKLDLLKEELTSG